ncbi:hypothetical protein [Neisseria wadsworthii]|uniref:hypothetical protein n=1 Tax=Neisseria wadsworthii TaxID=607711 RepID=UPI00131E4EC9|nr:hypothetical protein [Neisseria wadsworthii]
MQFALWQAAAFQAPGMLLFAGWFVIILLTFSGEQGGMIECLSEIVSDRHFLC